MTWTGQDNTFEECVKIQFELPKYTRGVGLDLGCGPYRPYPHFIGIDERFYGTPYGPGIVQDASRLDIFASESLDFIFSSHLLEEIDDIESALKEWWRVIKLGGYLVLYLPHKDFYPNKDARKANKLHIHDLTPIMVMDHMRNVSNSWDLVENQNRNQNNEYSFFQVYQKSNLGKITYSYMNEKPQKTCGIVRYGGYGDIIQASSILPQLKKEGYHITFYTTDVGRELIKTDPHIDEFYMQDRDQVPNQFLPEFWSVQAKKYTKWINMSESVEGTFLTIKGRAVYHWPHSARHRLCDQNYLEWAHYIADLPYEPHPTFYETDEEIEIAKKRKEEFGSPLIVWPLAGSSMHKVWPHMDQTIARIMITYPKAGVVLTGDEACQVLEQGWQEEKRVIKTCGRWGIRETLALAKQADLVIGPETGVLNAVGFLEIPKIILLSHSSIENLTRDWKNCISLFSKKTSCYPCHKLHYGYNFENCKLDKQTNTAHCQAMISADEMWESIRKQLKKDKGEGRWQQLGH